ncbi:type II toxin-antitoxin system Phd/YefM family antitoxin [Actinokineospora sp. HUAS TT18]|uniref:type II toxin-antitoxin system Phd/YefM family antitoxin n=1 Tax=Actinokineospora sp. HUAS TT18 TaxID=3447451 RepID=UPI003F51EBD4
MSQVIGQRELRNDNAEIMRRVEAGERFTVTRNGKPIADIVPHQAGVAPKRRSLGEVQAVFRDLPPMDVERWYRERAADDEVFGTDDPVDGAWSR